jgi:hypothetical protein
MTCWSTDARLGLSERNDSSSPDSSGVLYTFSIGFQPSSPEEFRVLGGIVEHQDRRTEYPDAVEQRIERARTALARFSESREESNDKVETKAIKFRNFAAAPPPPLPKKPRPKGK